MPEPSRPEPSSPDVQKRLQELAGLLRTATHLEPDAQRELADLVEELAKVLASSPTPAPEAAHLAESAAHMAGALQQQKESGLLRTARHRLEEATVRAQAKAPLATGIVRRLLAALADLGI
jgi:hypothetical protein